MTPAFPEPASEPARGTAPSADAVLSVAELNRRVSRLLEEGVPRLWVAGEVSNFKAAASGHWYFSIKDDAAAVRAVMFRGRAQTVGFELEVGGRYEFRVQVSLYEPRGDYQVRVEAVRKAGRGDLHEAFLRLRDQLTREGLIDPERRRPLPTMPRTVGVVTSLGAAALRDVLSVMARRAPHVRVIIYPALVQGKEAPAQLCAALRTAAQRAEIDVLLVVRGGGSLEDLWCFNDEALAREIAASPVPVISGVGHETDFTIADFVADQRAPTPTAAAELCCTDRQESLARLEAVVRRLVHFEQRLLERQALRLDRAAAQLISPAQGVALRRQRLQAIAQQLQSAMRRQLDTSRHRWQSQSLALRAMDPRGVLARGYAIVRSEQGALIKNALDLNVKGRIDIEFAQGRALADVVQIDTLL